MAQNFEPLYQSHVPQQSLRNKLREAQLPSPTSIPLPLAMNPSPSSPAFSSLQQHDLDKDFWIIDYQPTSLTNPALSNLSLSLPCQLESQSYSCVPALNGFFPKQNSSKQGRLNLAPLGPFTGYSSILKSSKFLRPAQEVLDDMCGGICENSAFPPLDCPGEGEDLRGSNVGVVNGVGVELGWKCSKLGLMLDEVCRRYKLYCQQMQSVVASFGTVAGLGNAAPFIGYAIKVVSKYFTSLKKALLDHIQFAGKTPADDSNPGKEKPAKFFQAEHCLPGQDSAPTRRFLQNPVWRSQRGLPDHAVAVLKTWLFEHFLHPYPTDLEKMNLAQQTGLSKTQVSNWFINARVRLWKPMVEEVHTLEAQQARVQLSSAINQNLVAPSSDLIKAKLPHGTSQHRCHDNSVTKRSRSELPGTSRRAQEQGNMSCNRSLNDYHSGASGSNDVSLALGLHQNTGMDLAWPMPINMAQHANMEMIRMMGSAPETGFRAPDQQFGRDR